jgi:GMP synthase-like glutamine amidotransferase
MYLYIVVQEKESYYEHGPDSRVKVRLEEASGERCLVVPYQEFGMSVVEELRPRAIAMSGFGGHWESREVAWFHGMDDVLHHAEAPIIGFCGSHQLIGFAFNRNLRQVARLYDEPMRKLAPEEELPRQAGELGEFFVAEGFYPIRRVKDDPLFAGLPEVMTMRCWHYCEVKELPPDFELLATSGCCRIEAMRHKTRPVYGTQFHPEAYEAPFFDGRTLLRNFAQIVEEFWAARRRQGSR